MRLRETLDRLGLEQQAVAGALRVRPETVSRWVAGQVPQGRNLLALLAYLQKQDRKVTLADITGRAA